MKKINSKDINNGFSIFAAVYSILAILFSFYSLTVVRNSLFAHNMDTLDMQTYQVYLRLSTILERFSSIIIYSIIIAVVILFVQFFKDFYKKKNRKKIEITEIIRNKLIIITGIYIVLFLFCGVLQNIMFDTVVGDVARDISNYWEFPTNFLIPFILCYAYSMCTTITKE